MIADIVFYTSLAICVSLGSYYKKIDDPYLKRHYGAGLGILVACLICGYHVLYTVFLVWGNVVIIKCVHRRFSHQISMAYTWTYLLYLHLNMSSIYIVWLHQTMALRLVGLAFELSLMKPKTKATTSKEASIELEEEEPSAIDIIAYSYFFIGLHKGPYFRWKIYQDHFSATFGTLGDCRIITEQKLKKALICAITYFLLKLKFSEHRYFEDDFYYEYGTDYRFLYNVPQLFIYFLQYQTLMMLSTSVCTEAGFGVYPAKCEPVPGYGPSTHPSLMNLAIENAKVALEQEYNFAMLKCFENEKLLWGPKMKDTLRGWDMPTRYWFWSNVYKNLLNANKEVRSASSFLAWSIWCGPSLQQFIVSSTLWVYINLEAEYSDIYYKPGPTKTPWDIGFSMMRLFCLIYLTPCIVLNDTSTVLRYYNSMFWMFHLMLLILIVGAIVAYKTNQPPVVQVTPPAGN